MENSALLTSKNIAVRISVIANEIDLNKDLRTMVSCVNEQMASSWP